MTRSFSFLCRRKGAGLFLRVRLCLAATGVTIKTGACAEIVKGVSGSGDPDDPSQTGGAHGVKDSKGRLRPIASFDIMMTNF